MILSREGDIMRFKYRKNVVVILITMLICSFLIANYIYKDDTSREVAYLYWGKTGDKVYELQRKLKQWGYYNGSIDGIYGTDTFEAVKRFQRKHGLKADGVVGSSTAAALGIQFKSTTSDNYQASRGGNIDRGDIHTLARAVHAEARGEPYVGKVAVAAVILNRVKHSSFPNTIAGVVYQPGAFTAVFDGQINLSPDNESLRAATDAMNGWDPTGGAIYYYNPAKSTSSWIWSRPVITVIGDHRFAR